MRLVPAAFLVWIVCILLSLRSAPGEYASFFRELVRGFSPVPSLPGMASALFRHAVLLGTAGVLTAASCGAGLPLLALVRLGISGLERICYALAFGWTALGFTLFGLALAGLFYPALIVAVPLLFLAAGVLRFHRSGLFRNLDEPGSGKMWACALLAGAPFFLFSPLYLSPPVYVDFNQYHMAAPELFLKLHRFVLDGTNPGFHLQLTAEMINAIGLVIGNDALAVLSALIPFSAAAVVAALWIRRIAGPEAAGLALGFSLVIKFMFLALGTGKNDSAEAGFCLLALVSQARGRAVPTALLYGISCAVKMNGLAFAGVAWLWHEASRIRNRRFGWRPDLAWIGLAALPMLPWFLKEYLLMGDPVWPVFSRWLPGALLDRESQKVLVGFLGRKTTIAGIPREAWDLLRTGLPVLAAGLPLVLVRWGAMPRDVRRVTALSLAMLAGYALVVHFDMDRKSYPLIMLWCFTLPAAATGFLSGLPAWARRAAVAAACLAAWAPNARTAGLSYHADTVRYLSGALSREEFLQSAYTTVREAQLALARLPGVKSVLLIGEHAPYRWPGRVRTEEFIDRKPTWVLATRSWDTGRMYARIRQWNVSHMVLNFIADGNVAPGGVPYASYPWDLRRLRLLRDFMKEHTEVAVRPVHSDQINGGFYVYGVVPRARPAGLIYYLPGIQEAMYQIYRPMFETGNNRVSLVRARDMIKLLPEVGQRPRPKQDRPET